MIQSLFCQQTIVAMDQFIPSTATRTLTTLCPAGLSALIMYRPVWLSLLSGMVTTDVVPEESTCQEQQVGDRSVLRL